MPHKPKVIVLFIVIAMLTGILSSCGGGEPVSNEDGTILSYTLKNLPAKGYFIRSEDVFYPLYKQGQNFTAEPKENLQNRVIWYKGKDSLIPRLKAGDEVVFRSSNVGVPDKFIFEGFSDKGYTIGASFMTNAENHNIGLYSNESNYCVDSTAYEKLTKLSDPAAYLVMEINKAPFDITMLDPNGVIPALQEGAKYLLGCYKGTIYEEIPLIADTRYYTSDFVREVEPEQPPYALTKSGYAVITIPVGLEPNNLYSINGQGCFYYEP